LVAVERYARVCRTGLGPGWFVVLGRRGRWRLVAWVAGEGVGLVAR
jgi:hypothetical protein